MRNFIVLLFLPVSLTSLSDTATEYDLCGNKNKSCTHHLWKMDELPKDACTVEHVAFNSEECYKMNFGYGKNGVRSKLGDVQLLNGAIEEIRQTVYAVGMSNIRWTSGKIRFSKIGDEKEKNVCRTFKIWKNVTVSKNSTLFYDCYWSPDYEGQDYAFEYMLEDGKGSSDYKKFVFKVLMHENHSNLTKIENLHVFSYVDITDPECLKLFIKKSKRFNITDYMIETFVEQNSVPVYSERSIVSCSRSINEYVIHTFTTLPKLDAHYYFMVSPINKECAAGKCSKSITPKIFIKTKYNLDTLIISLGSVFIFIMAILIFCLIYYKRTKIRNTSNRLFLVYDPLWRIHHEVVQKLCYLLQTDFQFEVFAKPDPAEPIEWANKVFRSCGTVACVISPHGTPRLVHQINGHLTNNIYGYSLTLVRENLLDTNYTKRIVVLKLPYSQEDSAIPPEFNNLKTFMLPQSFKKFTKTIHAKKQPKRWRCTEAFKEFERCVRSANTIIAEAPRYFPRDDNGFDVIRRVLPNSNNLESIEEVRERPFEEDISEDCLADINLSGRQVEERTDSNNSHSEESNTLLNIYELPL